MTNSKVTPRSKAQRAIKEHLVALAGIANAAVYDRLKIVEAYTAIHLRLCEIEQEIYNLMDHDDEDDQVTLGSNTHMWTGDKW